MGQSYLHRSLLTWSGRLEDREDSYTGSRANLKAVCDLAA